MCSFHYIAISVCSQRAENVLKSAKDVVQSLDEASAAQLKAEEAIKKSTEDISLARADLDEVHFFFSDKRVKISIEINLNFPLDRRRNSRRTTEGE